MLRARGYAVRMFDSIGRSFESSILDGEIGGAIDVSLTDLAAELLKTGYGAGPDRLAAAAIRRIPNFIVVGGLDAAEVPDGEQRPDRPVLEFESRRFLRTTRTECDRLGQEIAFKASVAEETTVVMIPRGGLSVLDGPGGPLWLPEANQALFQSLRNWISPRVVMHESPLSIAEPEIAAWIVENFLRFAPAGHFQRARNEEKD
jgi:uncharacterized protein (UPF0261 family)